MIIILFHCANIVYVLIYAYHRNAWNVPSFCFSYVSKSFLKWCVGIGKLCCRYTGFGRWWRMNAKKWMDSGRCGHSMHVVWQQWKMIHCLVHIDVCFSLSVREFWLQLGLMHVSNQTKQNKTSVSLNNAQRDTLVSRNNTEVWLWPYASVRTLHSVFLLLRHISWNYASFNLKV